MMTWYDIWYEYEDPYTDGMVTYEPWAMFWSRGPMWMKEHS